MKDIFFKSIYRSIFTGILILFGTMICIKNKDVKAFLYNNIYNTSLSLSKIKKIYNEYIGTVIPFEDNINTKEVFSEKLKYNELTTFGKGISLTLDNNYSIPIIKSGIVIYSGSMEDYNKTIIIEDEDGNDIVYGNLDKVNIKIYDYVKENDLLGTAKNNKLYLLFKKGEEYLDYKEFLK